MNILTLSLNPRELCYNLFAETAGRLVCQRQGLIPADSADTALALAPLAQAAQLIALEVKYGGSEFPAPVRVTPEVLRQLEQLAPRAPMHLPGVIALARACDQFFPGIPVVLVFQTACFAQLPAREAYYGIDPNLGDSLGIRRFGYNGLYHQAAVRHAANELRRGGLAHPARIISICLEPQPELAAFLDRRPLMVTRGATPLEGLPGQTACGEIDPSIVLILREKLQWGPEQINQALTRKSGLLGLLGAPARLDELFSDPNPSFELAREIVRYRLLNAAGAALACLSGVDALTFSGRYGNLGFGLGIAPEIRDAGILPAISSAIQNPKSKIQNYIAPWLIDRLTFKKAPRPQPIHLFTCAETLPSLLAQAALDHHRIMAAA